MSDSNGLKTWPGCPPWCQGHAGGPSRSHMSDNAFAGLQDDLLYPHGANVCLTGWDGEVPQVMLARHRTQQDGKVLFLSVEDAGALADILDGAGGADLASAIRSTLARLDGGERDREVAR